MTKENMTSFLAIGSIVKLKDDDNLIMITGFLPIDQSKDNGYFDYYGVGYPLGVVDNNCYCFNNDDIMQIIFEGYHDTKLEELKNEAITNWIKNNTYHKLNNDLINSTTDGNNPLLDLFN